MSRNNKLKYFKRFNLIMIYFRNLRILLYNFVRPINKHYNINEINANFYFFSGNLLTVVALLRCPKLRCHATTMFVISLAMSDLLFSTINLPLTASRYIHEDWKLGVPMCRYFILPSYWPF